mmetsp:Transcript_44367/g.62263  ORF Transcript_44367/g.62263 Transcript_44367/m.62263 type:complete len:202 (+) Transcript_44367:291-896(+)
MVLLIKLFHNFRIKKITSTTATNPPTLTSFFRIRPEHIRERAIIWLNLSIQQSNLIKCLDFWAESAMHTKNLTIDQCRNIQVIKSVCNVSPNISSSLVLQKALLVKTIILCNLSTFMISSQKSDPVWIANFVTEQQEVTFKAMITSVHEISKKNIIVVFWRTTKLKEFAKIEKLAMNVTTHSNWSGKVSQVPLLSQNILGH